MPEEGLEGSASTNQDKGETHICPPDCPIRLFMDNPGLISDPKLIQVIQGWESLAAPLKDAIIAMIGASIKEGGRK